jgi:multicomponent Na+:H+ antiporter subunit G
MDLVLDIISAMLLAAGTFFVFVGGVGVMRMPDFYTRMHAASLTDTGGAALIIAGLLLQGGLTLAPVKLLAIFLFLFLTSPTASYALANAALLSGLKPKCRNETGEALPDATPPLMSKRPPAPKPQPDDKQATPAAKKTPAKKPAAKKKAAKKS